MVFVDEAAVESSTPSSGDKTEPKSILILFADLVDINAGLLMVEVSAREATEEQEQSANPALAASFFSSLFSVGFQRLLMAWLLFLYL